MAAADRSLPLVARLIAASVDRAWLVVALGLAAGLAAMAFVATHFSINTNTDALLSSQLDYRQREIAFTAAFPQTADQIVVVVDGRTPELAELGAAELTARLATEPSYFQSVRRPDSGPFWAQEGLLFQSDADVKATLDRLIAAEPFLGPMAADPSLRGLMGALSTAAQGVSAGQTDLQSLRTPMARMADALERLERGQGAFFSWRELINGAPDPQELRKIILVKPKLDYSQLRPGAAASQEIRRVAGALGLEPAAGVRVRLTGDVPLQDEELGTLGDRALTIALVAFGAIVLMLWLAMRLARLIGAVLVVTLVGLVLAAAFGLLAFHAFNVISIAFIPLFVGLGIDFGIQVSVRYRAEHGLGGDWREALIATGRRMGHPLMLAAAAIAAGFLSFTPTAYVGLSQLGAIAGVGMLIALVLNLTLLPALILILRPPPAPRGPPSPQITALDDFILGRRRLVLGAFAAAAMGSVALLPLLHFDFNPLHLRSARTESVSTLLDLMKDPDLSPQTLDVLRPNLPAAQTLAARLDRLPQVASTRTLADFVPDDQPAKLALIADAGQLLDLALDPIAVAPPPSDAETMLSLRKTAADLRSLAAADVPGVPGRVESLRLAAALERLAQGPPALRAKASSALITPLSTVLDQVRAALAAQAVTQSSLPSELVRDWVAPDGRARVSIAPKGDADNDVVLSRFIDAVAAIAPDATGPPLGQREGGRAVVAAFGEAGVISFLAITALLFLVLRRPRDVAITMAPIVLTGVLTLGSCVLIGQPLNFANIIALPLLFGIGVAFHIYFVMSWRSGRSHLLNSNLARAVFFSALTTATGFGSLWLSNHPGTASMGRLLMISLIWTLVSALIFQPALMGDPKTPVTGTPERFE